MEKRWTVTVRSSNKDYQVDFIVFDNTCILSRVPETVEGIFVVPEWISHDMGMIRDVTGIGEGAFKSCPNLTGVIVPDTVSRILDGAFDDCSNLSVIIGLEHVPYVSQHAFVNCPKIDTGLLVNSRAYKEDTSCSGTMSASTDALIRRVEQLESKVGMLSYLIIGAIVLAAVGILV